MRAVILLALVACKQDKPKPAPAPIGVTPADAALVAIDAAPDAPPQPSTPVITQDGIGKLQRLAWDKQDEQATAKLIADALTPDLAGIEASFSVMDVPGEVEREEGYWSVKRGDTELVQILRVSELPGDKAAPAVMIAWTADVATADGIKVGDPLSRVLEKHPDLACMNGTEMVAEVVSADLTCTAGGLLYLLDPNKQEVKGSKPAPKSLADVPIVGIAAVPKP